MTIPVLMFVSLMLFSFGLGILQGRALYKPPTSPPAPEEASKNP